MKNMYRPNFCQNWTIRQPIAFQGIGLHTGQPVRMEIQPRMETGIIFKTQDMIIPAHVSYVIATERCTQLGRQGHFIGTVEHTLSALYGMGVSSAQIVLEGSECPIGDGSTQILTQRILSSGIQEISSLRQIHTFHIPLVFRLQQATILCLPAPETRFTYFIEFQNPRHLKQWYSFGFSPANYFREIAPCRTFGFQHEVENLWQKNMALGGSLENAVLIDNNGFSSSLRFPEECARHKILDLIGDLALSGAYWRGHMIAIKAGHTAHVKMVEKLLEQVT